MWSEDSGVRKYIRLLLIARQLMMVSQQEETENKLKFYSFTYFVGRKWGHILKDNFS
jgi:hypothetical protein